MLATLARNWWVLLVQGIIAIIFGLLAVFSTFSTLLTLVFIFGAYAFVDGVFDLIGAIVGPERVGMASMGTPRWARVLSGVFGILAGIVVFTQPGLSLIALLYFIAAWAIITGVMEVVFAIQFRKELPNEGWIIAGGLVSIFFGLVLFFRPITGALAMVWVLGIFAIIYGIIFIAFAFRLRAHSGRSGSMTPRPV